MSDEHQTEELREAQRKREQVEIEQARAADDEQEAAQHQRRADKARYLRRKLEERASAEREAKREA